MEKHEHVEYRGRTVCSCGDYNCASLDYIPSVAREPVVYDSTERDAVANAYKGAKWRTKVRKMDDTQVIAVYLRLKSQGKVK